MLVRNTLLVGGFILASLCGTPAAAGLKHLPPPSQGVGLYGNVTDFPILLEQLLGKQVYAALLEDDRFLFLHEWIMARFQPAQTSARLHDSHRGDAP